MTDSGLVLLEEFPDSFSANVARGFLESQGIESFLFDEEARRMGALTGSGGVRLMVNAGDADTARELLDEREEGE